MVFNKISKITTARAGTPKAKTTPNLITQISASEHEIELQKGGFGKKTIRIKTVNGYKLMIEAVLGTQPQAGEVLPGSEGTPTATPTQ